MQQFTRRSAAEVKQEMQPLLKLNYTTVIFSTTNLW